MIKTIERTELPCGWEVALHGVEGALDRPYSPFSGIRVAAAVVFEDNTFVVGVNYESASYGLTLCAERAAMARVQADGDSERVAGLILVAATASPTGPQVTGLRLTPCGACRQWWCELAQRLGRDLPLYTFAASGTEGLLMPASDLLPAAFSRDSLKSESPA